MRTLIPAALVLLLATPVVADTKVSMTYISDPPGAMIYEDGKAWGNTPLLLYYYAPGKFKQCLVLRNVKVRWISGAEVELKGLQACPAAGKKQQFTVFRPEGVEGREVDVQYAIALASRSAAAIAAVPPPPPLTMPTFCTTTVIGASVFTSCS